MKDIVDDIQALKREKNAVILAHLYQRAEIQDIADFVGDSLELSRKARDTQADVIVFCGVQFMAETAKILNPARTVLLPEKAAGCPMADMVTASDIVRLREEHPGAAVVCYVNSSAEVKAHSDICCTSSNAVNVVRSLPEEEIIFVPDKNLARYAARFFPNKQFIIHSGYCPTHNDVTVADVIEARRRWPNAPVLVHPECVPEVIDHADFVGSTAQIMDRTAQGDEDTFIIGTESGILHGLKKLSSGKQYVSLKSEFLCPDMKKTLLPSVQRSLEIMQYEIVLDGESIRKAAVCLERMLAV